MELEKSIVERARGGDRPAQTAFLRRYGGPLHALLKRSGVPNPDDAIQELLAKLLAVLPRFDSQGPATLSTWVFTVAHRWLLDQRKLRHLTLVPLEEALDIADPRPLPDRLLEEKQRAAALEAAIGLLPLEQRRIFALAQIHQHPLEAIAQVEGVPVGTIKSRLHRARAHLLALLHPTLSNSEGEAYASPRGA
jgi:RNA polymerase sigma-70 factor (ECF subfamily)